LDKLCQNTVKHSSTTSNNIRQHQTTSDNIRQHQTTSDTATHDDRHGRRTVKHDERRTVDDNGDTVRQTQKNRETHRAAIHRGVVKNQHWAEKWAIAEKRSTDF